MSADACRHRDPAMRWIVGGKAIERQAASTSQMGRFETELLATDANIEVLADVAHPVPWTQVCLTRRA